MGHSPAAGDSAGDAAGGDDSSEVDLSGGIADAESGDVAGEADQPRKKQRGRPRAVADFTEEGKKVFNALLNESFKLDTGMQKLLESSETCKIDDAEELRLFKKAMSVRGRCWETLKRKVTNFGPEDRHT